MTLSSFFQELQGNRVEGELLKAVSYSLVTSFVLVGILYFIKLRTISDFFSKYGFFLFFALVSYALILPSLRHTRAYRELPCMAGMMVGMTTGMLAGFLSAFYVAATNGMFVGSIFGMLVGMSLGAWNGKCCGIMGVMEALMAGFMGALMGAMTAFMLLNDHLRAASVIVLAVSALILFSLHYLIYNEMKGGERQLHEDHALTMILSLILTAMTTWLMVYGPRTGVFAS